MKISLPKFNSLRVNVSLLLTAILVLVLVYEAYLVYQFIYTNLSVDSEQIVPQNVVRIDLKAYQNTIDYLDRQNQFEAETLDLQRTNPFKP